MQAQDLPWRFDQFSWTAQVTIACWSGFRDASGPYGGQAKDGPNDGAVEIVFAPEGRDAAPLSDDEIRLVQWLCDNLTRQSQAVQAELLARYPQERLNALECFDDDESGNFVPEVSSLDGLKPLVGLYAINVLPIFDEEGVPYVGYELGCAWDAEHGCGVLMHGLRCVRFGGADTAFLQWMAESDLAGDRSNRGAT